MGRRLPLTSAMVCCLSLVLMVWLPQVLAASSTSTSDAHHTIDKRNVGVLARTGQLPYRQGKRYVASLARTGNLPLYIQKKLHPGMTSRNQMPELEVEPNEKRYLGALVRTGSLPFQFHAKRDPSDTHDEEDLEKLKALEAETKALESVLYLESQLNLELLKEKLLDLLPDEESENAAGEEKRSMSSLARSGNLPLKGSDEKRSVEALARAGYLPATQKTMAARNDNAEEEEVGKRSIAALAKNGLLKEGKRGGIGSLARNNLLPQKKNAEDLDELEELIHELIQDEQEKRNIGSLARGFNLPSYGKRNLGALAKGGGYARFAKNGAEDFAGEDEKRNIASLVRGRLTPLHEGKRYLGSLVRSQNLPFHKKDGWYGEEKRVSPMAIAKTWNYNNDGRNVDGIAKRYVAALLRQGRLPVGPEETVDTPETPESDEKEVEEAQEKRHLGSLKGSSINKRSIENQTSDVNGKATAVRTKRAAYLMPSSEEYPMPNVQNSELFDYDDLMEVMSGGAAPEKRFLGSVARSGWFRDSSRDRGYRGLDSMGKRHIGALARLGWLPQLRSSRYRRFGRAMPSRVCKRSTTDSREDPSDGSAPQDDAPFWRAPTSDLERRRSVLDDAYTDATTVQDSPRKRRYLLIPTVDNILLRKLYSRKFAR